MNREIRQGKIIFIRPFNHHKIVTKNQAQSIEKLQF